MACSTEAAPRGPLGRNNFTFAECEEYLVIEAVSCGSSSSSSSSGGGEHVAKKGERPEETNASPTHVVEVRKKKPTRKRIASDEGSTDSGYSGESKHYRTHSPDPQLKLQEEDDEEEWCVVDRHDARPAGLYGCRLVDYDDRDAEGNIHITDNDL